MDSTQIFNFISNNYGTLTGIGVSICGLIKTGVLPAIRTFIQEKNNIVKDERTKTLIENAESKVEKLLVESMSVIEKTTKEEIVTKIANNELTKDSLLELPSVVLNKVKNQLSDTYTNALKSEYGDFEDYLATKMQYLYDTYKNDDKSVIGSVKVSDIVGLVTKTASDFTSEDISSLQAQLSDIKTEKENLTNQLAQTQTENANVTQQLEQVKGDKAIVDQANAQLANQVNDLTSQNASLNQQVSILTNQINTITSTLSQVVQPITTVTDNSVQTQTVVNESTVTL